MGAIHFISLSDPDKDISFPGDGRSRRQEDCPPPGGDKIFQIIFQQRKLSVLWKQQQIKSPHSKMGALHFSS
jgi:hypothetical protein